MDGSGCWSYSRVASTGLVCVKAIRPSRTAGNRSLIGSSLVHGTALVKRANPVGNTTPGAAGRVVAVRVADSGLQRPKRLKLEQEKKRRNTDSLARANASPCRFLVMVMVVVVAVVNLARGSGRRYTTAGPSRAGKVSACVGMGIAALGLTSTCTSGTADEVVSCAPGHSRSSAASVMVVVHLTPPTYTIGSLESRGRGLAVVLAVAWAGAGGGRVLENLAAGRASPSADGGNQLREGVSRDGKPTCE